MRRCESGQAWSSQVQLACMRAKAMRRCESKDEPTRPPPSALSPVGGERSVRPSAAHAAFRPSARCSRCSRVASGARSATAEARLDPSYLGVRQPAAASGQRGQARGRGMESERRTERGEEVVLDHALVGRAARQLRIELERHEAHLHLALVRKLARHRLHPPLRRPRPISVGVGDDVDDERRLRIAARRGEVVRVARSDGRAPSAGRSARA
jgi:hypothetical protein